MPKFVMVLGRKVPIKMLSKQELDKFIPHAEGIFDTYTRSIYICKSAPKHVQKYYLYHEIGHALKHFVGLDQVISPEVQEIIVQSYATLIEDILSQRTKLNG